ncbi:MAG: dihydrodipicolinate synthase family protein [Candidatus Solibacter usitatus]|nr:dihydrodipicolinate synthase family protein [Candidatus Solibacter usitatus]
MNPHDIAGIIPPLVTPFDSQGRLLEQVHRAEVRFMVETARVHGLAVAGSTGEGHALSTEEVRRLAGWTVEEAGGRVPVIAGIIADSTQAAVERAMAVADVGVAALQVTPVHYLFRPDDDGMLEFFAAITRATGIPVIVYNVVPWSYLLPPLLARILREVEGVMGVKQSASDMKALADLLLLVEEGAAGPNKRILSAVDALLYPSFLLGAHGAVAAILTAAPEWCVELWDAVQRGDHAQALQLHRNLLRLWNAIHDDNLPANVKTVMELCGRPGGLPRPPMPVSSPAQVRKIRDALFL